eukprot:1680997-Heterocapsa_arctica.AAC.1
MFWNMILHTKNDSAHDQVLARDQYGLHQASPERKTRKRGRQQEEARGARTYERGHGQGRTEGLLATK